MGSVIFLVCNLLNKVMDYDKILLELGEFGKWQKFNNLMLWIASIAGGMTSVMVIISIMEPSNGFRCRNE